MIAVSARWPVLVATPLILVALLAAALALLVVAFMGDIQAGHPAHVLAPFRWGPEGAPTA
jgi:hypothetical protein